MAGRDLTNREGIMLGFRRGVSMTVNKEEWDRLNEEYIIAKDLSNDEALKIIRNITKQNESSIQAGKGYSYTLPSRSASHVEYVKSVKQLCLKRRDEITYRFGDPKTGHHAIVITAVLSMVQAALLDKIPIDRRALFYRDVRLFGDQGVSDDALYDICCLIGSSRHCLNVTASPKGLFMGPITLQMQDLGGPYEIACQVNSMEGAMVPISPGNISKIVYTGKESKTIKFILVVEKETVFHYLVRRKFHINFNCIIITGSGQPDTSTKSLLSRLCAKFQGIPVYAFVDPDPHGILIYCTYKFGSKNLSFDNFGLAADKLVWIGLSHVEVSKILPKSRRPLTATDKSILNTLLITNYLRADVPLLMSNICAMINTGSKYEIEALDELGTTSLYDSVVSAIQSANKADVVTDIVTDVPPHDAVMFTLKRTYQPHDLMDE